MRLPKDSSSFHWTNHVMAKMLFYRLGEQRVRRVIANPKRRETGIVSNTISLMQRNDTAKRKEEIWVMIQTNKNIKTKNEKLMKIFLKKTIVISAWRYPGVSKPGAQIPMPEGLQKELEEFFLKN